MPVKHSSKSTHIEDTVRGAVTDENGMFIDRVTSRECISDRFSGVEVKIYGSAVPCRPIIDAIAEEGGAAIESMDYVNESDEPHLCVFIAYIPEQEHPAFV